MQLKHSSLLSKKFLLLINYSLLFHINIEIYLLYEIYILLYVITLLHGHIFKLCSIIANNIYVANPTLFFHYDVGTSNWQTWETTTISFYLNEGRISYANVNIA